MSRLLIETRGPCDWRSRLAKPDKQWSRGFSALEAAVSWEKAARHPTGLPEEIRFLLDQHSELANPELVIGIVEHKVALKDGRRPSQNDVWALVKVSSGLLSLAVEAKAGEPFAELVSAWLAKAEKGSNKAARLKYLRGVCGIRDQDGCDDSRYQLLHRTASPLIEAERFGASSAAMIVQSFRNPARPDRTKEHLRDFEIFGRQFGVEVGENRLVRVIRTEGIPLYLGWVTCGPASDADLASLL